jgi:DnaK suppressor protein
MNGLTKEQLGHFRRLLEEERDRANAAIFDAQDRAQQAADDASIAQDEVDQSTSGDAVDRTLQHGQRASERFDEIERALARMDRGDYGRCVMCRGDIGYSRLVAMPTTNKCADCAIATDHRHAPSI